MNAGPARGMPCSRERIAGGMSGEEPLLLPGTQRRYSLSVALKPRVEP